MAETGLLTWVIAIALGVVIWRSSMAVIRMLSTPPPEVDPEDVRAVNQPFRCTVCGAEATMTVSNVREEAPPKHCREEMVPVWRAE